MRVFVAGEGVLEDDDFSWTVPGELVHFPTVICADPVCGCERSMCGFASHKATTVFEVRDLGMAPDTYTGLLLDSLKASGWLTLVSEEDQVWLDDWVDEHLCAASDFPPGVPLRFNRWVISTRHPSQAR